jgi:hypothetical protein
MKFSQLSASSYLLPTGLHSAGLFVLSLAGCNLLPVRINGQESVQPKTGETTRASSEKPRAGGVGATAGKPDATKDALALRQQTRALTRELDSLVKESSATLPQEKLAELQKKSKEFADAKLDAEVVYLKHLSTYYALENAWRGESGKAPEALAGLLGGAASASGEVAGKDKPQTFKFAVAEGHCYTVLMRLKNAGSEEDKVTDFDFDAGKDTSTLLAFTMGQRTTRGAGSHRSLSTSYTDGVCATKSATVSARVKLQYAGSQNGLRYVVVDTSREKFPEYVALEVEPRFSDGCDVDNHVAMWTNPIPGAILYGSSEPLIPSSVGQAEEMWMTAWDPAGRDVRVKRDQLSSAPPNAFKFDPKPRAEACPHKLNDAKSGDGIKVATCYEGMAKRYDPLFEAAERARSSAQDILSARNANARLEQLQKQFDDEESKSCGRIRGEVAKKFEAAHNKIVDFYLKAPIKNAFDRGNALKLTYEGAEEIGCAGVSNCSL